MKLELKETIWREIYFEDGTTEKQILDYIKEFGKDNIYDAPFYLENEVLYDTNDTIEPDFNQGGNETVVIRDEDYNEVYNNDKN